MIKFVCVDCHKDSYSSCASEDPCIYCGGTVIEAEEKKGEENASS